MRVLFYNHAGQVSGAERIMLLILEKLNKGRFEASVVCPPEGELAQLVEKLDVPVNLIESLQARFTWRPDRLIKYLWSFFRVTLQFRAKVGELQPELIHANSIRAGLIATTATLGMKVPIIWHLLDMLPRHPLSTIIRWYAALSSRTHHMAVSQSVARRFDNGVLTAMNASDRMRVIYTGIDLDRFAVVAEERKRVRAELGLTPEQFTLGIVGQITPRKGQLELVKAFARALPQTPGATLLIVGAPLFTQKDHEYLRESQRAAEELGIASQVKFIGARKDVAAVMQALDLLVLNSKAEPFGLVLLEAMACGTPVLATAVDGVLELIEHQVSGWLVPAQDEPALVNALVELGNNVQLRRDIGQQAQQNVVPHFSGQKFLAQVEHFYQQVGRPVEICRPQELLTESSSGD